MKRPPRIPFNAATAFASLLALVTVAALSAIVLARLLGPGGQAERGQRNSDRVREVAQAVLRHRVDASDFPPDLQALVPRYLPRVPELEGEGTRWSYHPIPDEDRFSLACVHDGVEWTCNYFAENDTVSCDTK